MEFPLDYSIFMIFIFFLNIIVSNYYIFYSRPIFLMPSSSWSMCVCYKFYRRIRRICFKSLI